MNLLIQKAYSETSSVLSSIYKKRKQTLFFQKIMWAITGLFLLLLLLNLMAAYLPFFKADFLKPFQATATNPYADVYPIVGLMTLLYPVSYFFVNAFQQFKRKETAAITKMVQSLFPKVEFAQEIAAPLNEVKSSKLFAWVKTNTPIYCYGQLRSRTRDHLINITDIGIVEQNASKQFLEGFMRIPVLNMFAILYQYVLKNLLTNKSADNLHYTYRGMFCWLSFKKSLKGHTVILTNNQRSKLDRFFSANFSEEQKILLEDPRFTDQFVVYSTDQVEARYVLSTALMERIVALKEKFNQPILLSFQHKQMYLAVQNEHGLFSFPSGKLDAISIVDELANDINTALQVAAIIKLK